MDIFCGNRKQMAWLNRDFQLGMKDDEDIAQTYITALKC